jgi:hypothetical protein
MTLMVTPESQIEFVLLKQRNCPTFSRYLAKRLTAIRRDNPRVASFSDEELLSLPVSIGGTPLGELVLNKWRESNGEHRPHTVS